jgi:hypothetical protein
VERKSQARSAAAVIQQTRAVVDRARMGSEGGSPSGIPVVRQAPAAAPPAPPPAPAPEETAYESKGMKASFGDDDLDVPAFMRKRQENQ